MMAMFIADHVESRLLAAADTRTNRELVGRFRGHIVGHAGPIGGGGSGASDGAVVEALEKMADRQSDAFQSQPQRSHETLADQNELLKKQIESTGGGGGGGGRNGGGGGGGGFAGGNGSGGGGSIEPSQLQEIIMHTAGLAGMQHGELHVHNEIIRELADVVRPGSLNWPYRKAMRRKLDAATPPAGRRCGRRRLAAPRIVLADLAIANASRTKPRRKTLLNSVSIPAWRLLCGKIPHHVAR